MFFKQTFLPRPLFRMLSNISLQTEIFSAVDVVEAIDTFLNQGKIHPFQRESLRQV